MLKIFLFIIAIAFVPFGSEGKELFSVKVDDTGKYLNIYYINKTLKPVNIYQNFVLNPCSFKHGFCMQEVGNNDDLYADVGGPASSQIKIKPYKIFGNVASKEHLPFNKRSLFTIPNRVIFHFFLPEDIVVSSGVCEFEIVGESFSLDCE